MSTKNEIITNIVNGTNKDQTTSVTPRNLTTTKWCYVSSDSDDDDDFNGASLYHREPGIPDGRVYRYPPKQENWKQRMIDHYGPVHGPNRISRTPVDNINKTKI